MAKIMDTTTTGAEFTRNNNWKEIAEPALFNFDKIGQTLEGMVLAFENEQIENRPVLVMKMELKGGELVKIRPSFNLRQKLGKRLLGKRILIVYDCDNDATIDKGNSMKMFRVFVAPDVDATESPFVATDADVPDFE